MKLLLCDDHALIRDGIRRVLEPLAPELDFIECGDAETALAHVEENLELDLVLLDLKLPGMGGLEALARMREIDPSLPIIICSETEERGVLHHAFEHGAAGFVPKSSTGSVLLAAIQLVLAGGTYIPPFGLEVRELGARSRDRGSARTRTERLSPRQRDVARLAARGLTNAEIAGVLEIREATVKAHMSAVFAALDVKNRSEVGMVLREWGED